MRDIRITKDYGRLPHIWCRGEQIRRVLHNLITNACEAAIPGRALEITLRTRALSDAVQFQIQDNGAGIGSDAVTRVFEPFYTTKHGGDRTGLGLAIVKRIVEAHRGSITVRAEPEFGSVFTVVIPVGKAALAKAA